MAVKDENSSVLQQLKHPQDVETSEEKKIRYRLEWAIKKFLSFYSTFFSIPTFASGPHVKVKDIARRPHGEDSAHPLLLSPQFFYLPVSLDLFSK